MTSEEDKELLNEKTRKILTCNGLFHPCANVSRLYLKGCKGAKGLISVKDFVLSEYNGLCNYLEKSEEPMLKKVVKGYFIMEKEETKKYDKRNETKLTWKVP